MFDVAIRFLTSYQTEAKFLIKSRLTFASAHKQTIFLKLTSTILFALGCIYKIMKMNQFKTQHWQSVFFFVVKLQLLRIIGKCAAKQTHTKKPQQQQHIYGKSDEVTELHPPQAKNQV